MFIAEETWMVLFLIGKQDPKRNTMTVAMEKIINESIAHGFNVKLDTCGRVEICKRTPKTRKIYIGLEISPSGTGYDMTVECLQYRKGLRSYKDFRKILKLE
jgi:hypothetical protein